MTVLALPTNPVTFSLTELATCLCAQIVADGSPDVCFCGVIPGEGVSSMYGGDCTKKCGMAWVRLVSATPAVGVGVSAERPGNCASGLGYDVEMGVMRCTPVGDATNPPTPAQLLAAAELQYADLLSMRRAVSCCIDSGDWMLNAYTPVGPNGGMVGGAWLLTMWSP